MFIRLAIDVLPVVVVHAALLAIPFLDVNWIDIILIPIIGFGSGLGITIGFHRYLTHRGFKTSRLVQFTLAAIGCVALQHGPMWWVAHHRRHHAHSDADGDTHSPNEGFWHAHMGWLFRSSALTPDYRIVRDIARYPELAWLERFWLLPGILVATGCYYIDGWSGVVIGFCGAIVAGKHMTWSVNSIGHMVGKQPYDTGDRSRNVWILGLLALGEGWHNNHHHSPRTARHGFKWYQVDPSYYVIWTMEKLGLVWDVKKTPRPPHAPVEPEPHLTSSYPASAM